MFYSVKEKNFDERGNQRQTDVEFSKKSRNRNGDGTSTGRVSSFFDERKDHVCHCD